LLAEPMVAALMRRDGISIGEARALYDSVAPQLKDRAKRARSRATSPGHMPWTRCCSEQISPPKFSPLM
jgi:hypothetical protein